LSCRKEDIFLMISETKPRADELMCDRGPVIMLSRGDTAAIGGCDSSTPCFRNLSPPSCLAVLRKSSEAGGSRFIRNVGAGVRLHDKIMQIITLR
jgi:hypothetical protein